VDRNDVNPALPDNTTKSELLFLHLVLRALDMGGRAAVIVPDGVLFGSSRAHVETRKKIVEENRLDGVVSMPSGVFKPYAGVSTAILFLTRGGRTERIWFYDMAHDGFSLDDKRTPVMENDIPDVIQCWKNRLKPDFETGRRQRLDSLRREVTPLKEERRKMEAEIDRLTFESAIAPENLTTETLRHGNNQKKKLRELRDSVVNSLSDAQARYAELQSKIVNPQSEIEQLTRQFWVDVTQVRANKYDLSASRYRQADNDETYHESPGGTLERLSRLEQVMVEEIDELKKIIGKR